MLLTTHCWLRAYALLATPPTCTRRAPELTTLTTSVLLCTRRAPEGFAEQQGAHGGFDGGVEHEGDDDDDEEGDLRRVQRLEDLRRTGSGSGSGSGPWSEVRARVGAGMSGLRSSSDLPQTCARLGHEISLRSCAQSAQNSPEIHDSSAPFSTLSVLYWSLVSGTLVGICGPRAGAARG